MRSQFGGIEPEAAMLYFIDLLIENGAFSEIITQFIKITSDNLLEDG